MRHRLRPHEKVFLALLGVVTLIFFFYKYIFANQLKQYIEMKTTLHQLVTMANAAEQTAGSLRREIEFADSADKQLNDIAPLFSTEMRDGLALVQMGVEAGNANVEIISFATLPAADKEYYIELPARIAVRGRYPEVERFIAWLEKQPNLSEIRSLKIESPEKGLADLLGSEEKERQSGKEKEFFARTVIGEQNTPERAAGSGELTVSGMAGKQEMTSGDTVVAVIDLVTYSLMHPRQLLNINQVTAWNLGRTNPFLPVEEKNER
ncbi:MAG: type 4a pilus biogenesis protein PilO [Firmicutes bacterium]|nr:type 4a pilus biogenesis protein PilO [Bacillota bacterium]